MDCCESTFEMSRYENRLASPEFRAKAKIFAYITFCFLLSYELCIIFGYVYRFLCSCIDAKFKDPVHPADDTSGFEEGLHDQNANGDDSASDKDEE